MRCSSPGQKTGVVAGGFVCETDVQYSYGNVNVSELMASHEEADTRLMLHSIYSGVQTIVVLTRNTDILVFHLVHRSKIPLSSYG